MTSIVAISDIRLCTIYFFVEYYHCLKRCPSVWLSDDILSEWAGLSLLSGMACLVIDAKHVSEPIPTHWRLDL